MPPKPTTAATIMALCRKRKSPVPQCTPSVRKARELTGWLIAETKYLANSLMRCACIRTDAGGRTGGVSQEKGLRASTHEQVAALLQQAGDITECKGKVRPRFTATITTPPNAPNHWLMVLASANAICQKIVVEYGTILTVHCKITRNPYVSIRHVQP